ncbi:MAG: hypothetical protein AAGM04_03660 [Pseudomonadota bacterium]
MQLQKAVQARTTPTFTGWLGMGIVTLTGCVLATLPSQTSAQALPAPVIKTQAAKDPAPEAKTPRSLNSVNGVIRLFGTVLVYPLPDWTPLNTNALKASRFNRQQRPGVFALQAIPKTETGNNWRNLYGILAIERFRGGPLRHLAITEGNFRQNCAADRLRLTQGTARVGVPTLFVACGAYTKDQTQGQIGVFVFLQNGQTAVRLYREWRGPAFDPDKQDSWPVDRAQLKTVFENLQAAQLNRVGSN